MTLRSDSGRTPRQPVGAVRGASPGTAGGVGVDRPGSDRGFRGGPSHPEGANAPAGNAPDGRGRQAALEVLLLLAETDAGWGDYESALDLLDCAAAVARELPSDYELKRARWMHLLSEGQNDCLAA
jgi:hypothetical protein